MSTDMSVKWSMRRHPDGTYTGEILIPLKQVTGGYKDLLLTSARGNELVPSRRGGAVRDQRGRAQSLPRATSKGEALQQASSLAQDILGNPLLASMLPPGTGVAVQAIDFLAKNEAVGDLAEATKNIVGEGAKRLASALKFW